MSDEMSAEGTYLGDGVTATFDGYMIRLRADRDPAKTIYLEPSVFDALTRYAATVWPGEPGEES